MDLTRVLGALLGGAAQPPRRRRRAQPSLLGRSGNQQLARVLGSVAGAAIEAMMKGRQSAPPPAPPPAPKTPRATGPWGGAPAPAPAPQPGRRLPDVGSQPWPEPAPPEPQGPSAEDAEALLLIRAMIAAAKSDGRVDPAERGGIAQQLDAAGLSAEERDFVLADFDTPLSPEALAKQAGDPMLRARLYAAAFAGAGEVTPDERAWLDQLAKALKLDKAAAAAIEERLA